MFSFFRNLFNTHREFVGDFIETGDELRDLAASNRVVAAELEESRIQTTGMADQKDLIDLAEKSAAALSGYGISVKAQAFIDVAQD